MREAHNARQRPARAVSDLIVLLVGNLLEPELAPLGSGHDLVDLGGKKPDRDQGKLVGKKMVVSGGPGPGRKGEKADQSGQSSCVFERAMGREAAPGFVASLPTLRDRGRDKYSRQRRGPKPGPPSTAPPSPRTPSTFPRPAACPARVRVPSTLARSGSWAGSTTSALRLEGSAFPVSARIPTRGAVPPARRPPWRATSSLPSRSPPPPYQVGRYELLALCASRPHWLGTFADAWFRAKKTERNRDRDRSRARDLEAAEGRRPFSGERESARRRSASAMFSGVSESDDDFRVNPSQLAMEVRIHCVPLPRRNPPLISDRV